MLTYPKTAITSKSIDRFNYEIYTSIGINMLKYNHDSSSVIRLFVALCNDSFSILEDLHYQPKLSLTGLEFTSIDRIRKYSIKSIPSIDFFTHDFDNSSSNYIIGYSTYTDKEYTLSIVNNENDFSRHSLPCDMFLCGSVEHSLSNTYELPPYVKINCTMKVSNSQITIGVLGGISILTKDSNNLVIIRISGRDWLGDAIVEDIVLLDQIEYVSDKEYYFVDTLMLIGNTTTATVRLFPYINGEHVSWSQMYVDREDFSDYRAILSVNQSKNQLVISKINSLLSEYPNIPDPVQNIKLKTQTQDEIITTYYIDVNNKLLYTSTDQLINEISVQKRFYCYPLIMPYVKNNKLETLKTEYQSIKVEYYTDTLNRECVFYIFPSERHNGIESLSIIINKPQTNDTCPSWKPFVTYNKYDEVAYNGEVYTCTNSHISTNAFSSSVWKANVIIYSSDVLLDLYRENIETNRIRIPFEELFIGDNTECILEFRTYGYAESVLPIHVYEPTINFLYVKNLEELITVWKIDPPNTYQWLSDSDKSSYTDYTEFYSQGLGYGLGTFGGEENNNNILPIRFGGSMIDPISSVFIYKLTNVGNICINDTTITNVFNTFIFNDYEQSIITSDTITAIRGSNVEV